MQKIQSDADSGGKSVSLAEARPPVFLARLLRAASLLRILDQPAKSALRALIGAGRLPRYVLGTINRRPMRLDLVEMVDQKIFLYGAFDQRGLALMQTILRAMPCRTLFDVGANIGSHTAFFCDLAEQVHAFEPNPPVFARLKAFVEVNRLANVTLHACGLSDKEGTLSFFTSEGRAHIATFEERPGSVNAGVVPIAKGDDIVRARGIKNVDFLKADVEGHEFEALHGLQQTIARDRPVMVLEHEEKSLRKFGVGGLQAFLPRYKVYGTYRTLLSRLFKTRLGLEPIVEGKEYSHVVCIPQERVAALTSALKLPS